MAGQLFRRDNDELGNSMLKRRTGPNWRSYRDRNRIAWRLLSSRQLGRQAGTQKYGRGTGQPHLRLALIIDY